MPRTATRTRDDKRRTVREKPERPTTLPASPGRTHPIIVYAGFPLLLAATLLVLCIRPILDPDCWFHMALGRYLLQNRAFPPGDVFSFTAAGNEWISSGWLSSILMQVAYSTAGAPGLAFLTFGFMTAAFLTAYFWAVRRYSVPVMSASILVIAMLASYLRFSPRPENASYLFLALTLSLLTWNDSGHVAERGRRMLWALPLVVAAWANLHAGFIVGLVACALFIPSQLYLAARTRLREHWWLALPVIAALVAWLANPYGWRVFALAGKIKSMPGVKEQIYEWMPLFGGFGVPFPWTAKLGYLAVLLICAGAAAISWRRMSPWQWITFLFFAALPFYERRHVGLSALALPIIITPHMVAIERIVPRAVAALPLVLAVSVVLLVIQPKAGIYGPGQKLLSAKIDDTLLPRSATEFMKTNPPPPNLFNPYGPGGYLLYHLSPDTKVFIDGRLDVYNRETWIDYMDIDAGRMDVQDAIRKYNFNSMLIFTQGYSNNPDHLVLRVNNSRDWKLVYFDDSYTLYVRTVPENADYLRKHAYRYANPLSMPVQEAMAAGPDGRRLLQQEIQRAMKESNGSAKAHVIAAVAAQAEGNETLAQHHMSEARKQNPMISLGRK